jgi:hypothetical protein
MIATGVDIVASAILLKDAKVLKHQNWLLVAAVVKSGLAPTLSEMQTLPSMLQRTLHLKARI